MVGWKAIRGTAIAITYVWYHSKTGAIVESDVAFNNSFAWSYTPPIRASGSYDDPDNGGVPGTFDVQNTGTHEAGHTLMLNDLYDESHVNLTMYGDGSYGELQKDTLALGDDLGVKAIC